MKNTSPLFLSVLIAFIPPAGAQDLPPSNTAVILKQLDQVASEMSASKQTRRSAAISQIQSALSSGSSSVEFYLRSLDNTKYRDNHQNLVDWRRRNEELMHSSAFQSAAQLQLHYLLIALQRSKEHDALAQAPEILSYLSELAAHDTHSPNDKTYPDAENLINQPLSSSSVVEWIQINDLLPTDNNFASSPGDYQGIMEKNVRTPLREKNDPRLPSTWDTQIAVESAQATISNSKQQIENFNQKRLPELLFKKAQDTAAIGQPNRGVSEIMILIQKYPMNPDVKSWVDAARKLLTKPASSMESLPTPESAIPHSRIPPAYSK
jgi:hypothetical protein